jgi:hypothetical protein
MKNELIELAAAILQTAETEGIEMRLLGGIAFWERCPNAREIVYRTRFFKDIDLAAKVRDKAKIESIFHHKWNFYLDPDSGTIPGSLLSRYYVQKEKELKEVCEINYDVLKYCHDIDIRDRLSIDKITIPLAELMLSKLQIIDLASQDIVDLFALLLDHELGDCDGEKININVILNLCRRKWGLEKTVRTNLNRIEHEAFASDILSQIQKEKIIRQIKFLFSRLSESTKSFSWKFRSIFGEILPWYNKVESPRDGIILAIEYGSNY